METPEALNEWKEATTTTLEAWSAEPTLDIETTLGMLQPLTDAVTTAFQKKGKIRKEDLSEARNLAKQMAEKIPLEQCPKVADSLSRAMPELHRIENAAAHMLLSRVDHRMIPDRNSSL